MKLPRIMIAAPGSGSGKTTVTCAILQALKNRGLHPVSSKCGPDYIDPMFHEKVLGIPSNNLDLYFSGKKLLRSLLADHAQGADLAVIEGVMGYYDGRSMGSDHGSSYETAKITQTPVVLVVSCKGMALSLAAVVKGLMDFRSGSNIAGLILNGVSAMLYPRLREMLENELEIPVIGYLPLLKEIQMESRHLGLVMPEEIKSFKSQMELLGRTAEETIDLDLLLKTAGEAPAFCAEELKEERALSAAEPLRIGVAKDEAFCFYYSDNLKYLERSGCELLYFSPLHDPCMPKELDGLYIGGGYPELYAEKLAENVKLRNELKELLFLGIPCIAECGGFMYLHEQMEGENGREYPMTGVIKGRVFRTDHLVHFGYASLTAKEDNQFQKKGQTLRAHEFHYWDSTDPGKDYRADKPDRNAHWDCLHVKHGLFAGYPHIHFYSNPEFISGYLKLCAQKGENR